MRLRELGHSALITAGKATYRYQRSAVSDNTAILRQTRSGMLLIGGCYSMAEEVLSFYNELAGYYHLLFEDWDLSIRRQASILDSIISHELRHKHLRILDCACGIGTQSLGLAHLGHHLLGCDLSSAQVARANKEAKKRGLDLEFRVSDMIHLKEIPETGFDVVSAFDNALPHLSVGELAQAVETMGLKLKPGGLLIASIRDYDALLELRPSMQEPTFFGHVGNRRIVHQVWDWIEPAAYLLHLYITLEVGEGWRTHHFVSWYRAVRRQELSKALREAGFHEPVWLMPAESGYYQPLILARRP
ncbi:class I SAM-dependent DNA methyltransferase [Edaphobacter flagellatus]|uniref:class I SAM-dependent DNA methyltransferase n=1 Tax=Edaphobacter flagellatus TaxID=1933044 RepID=UPI0021B2584E|nr:class I SAM-dependent methyltransferase [Edaphobacter flagellatus]